MLIRNAKPKDFDQLGKWMVEFTNQTIPYKKVDPLYITGVLQVCMSNHVCLVAEEDGKLLGTIVAMYVKHPLNPEVSVLQELAWWVSETERGTGVGQALLDTFASIKKSDITVMSLLPESMRAETALERVGFKVAETAFVKDNRD